MYGTLRHVGRRVISAARPFHSRGLSFLFLVIWFCAPVFGQLTYDLNSDGIVNLLDFVTFADGWNSGSYGLPELEAFSQEWLEGQLLPGAASNPTPDNGATDVNLTQDLSWTADSGATSHDVYFGTTNPPVFIGNQTDTTYDTGTMETNTTYYWRIDEKNSGGTTTGTVWNFATVPPPPDANYVRSVSVSNPTGATRYHHSLEIVLDPNFNWVHIDANFTTLRFYDSQNNLLDYWIEHLDYAGQKAVIWVRIPQLDVNGTVLTMGYGSVASEPYQSQSYTAMLKRPPSGLTLETYPKDHYGGNLSCLHPCVVRAQGWMKNSVPDANDIQWVMVNTPYPHVQWIDGPWTIALTENPALWVCTDPNAQTGWQWPAGYSDWPQAPPGGDSFAKEMKRYDSVLHDETTKSNLLVAPPRIMDGTNWKDPVMVWLPELNGGTLRVYFLYGNGDLYCLDLTSAGSSWADSNGANLVSFGGPNFDGPKICSINQGGSIIDFTSKNAREPGRTEVVCPSVLQENGVWYMITVSDSSSQVNAVLQKWASSDGIIWTKDPQRPTIDYPTGIVGPPFHHGMLAYQGRWFLFGNTGVPVPTGSTKSHLQEYLWVSEDQGETWQLQLPKCLSRQGINGGFPEDFTTPYRFWPVYEQDKGLMVFAGFENSKAGYTYSFGGTCLITDPNWSPVIKRPMPNINSVFWSYALDFSDPLVTAGLVTDSDDMMEWPEVVKKRLINGITVAVIDGKLRVSGSDFSGIQTFELGSMFSHYRLRADCDPTISSGLKLLLGSTYHVALDVNNSNHQAIIKLRDWYGSVLGTVNSSSSFGTAGTYDYKIDVDGKDAWFNVFRMESQDYLPLEPMPAAIIPSHAFYNNIFGTLSLNQSNKWFGLYFGFARPGLPPENEPSAELGVECLQP